MNHAAVNRTEGPLFTHAPQTTYEIAAKWTCVSEQTMCERASVGAPKSCEVCRVGVYRAYIYRVDTCNVSTRACITWCVRHVVRATHGATRGALGGPSSVRVCVCVKTICGMRCGVWRAARGLYDVWWPKPKGGQ
jgi:hypothetical protein